jgi:hypothetical protein
MSVQYGGDKITFSDGSTVGSGWTGFKNRIINGAMMIDQRNAGASVSLAGGNFPVDRMRLSTTGITSIATVQQNLNSITPPVGFQNYIGMSVTSGAATGSTAAGRITQRIEGFNVADLGFGATGASTVTLSFWVRSSLTGTFGGSLQNNDGNRVYVFSYTINAANTWEQKTVTITGDTTGTWLKTNGIGMILLLSVGSGSTFQGSAGSWGSTYYDTVTGQVDVLATTGATFYITGVQLEKGSTATSFDYRPYGTELALCQRYYQKNYNQANAVGSSSGNDDQRNIVTAYAGNEYSNTIYLKQTMRAIPSISFWTSGGVSGNFTALPSTSQRAVSAGSISDNGFMVSTNGVTSDGSLQGMWAASAEL